MDEVFKALADASRRQLLDELFSNNGQTLTELCGHLDMTRQAVTKHLAVLEAANLVVTVWRGREKLHYLNPVPISEIQERWIGKFEHQRLQALGDLKKNLKANEKKEKQKNE
jgi:DNA-binding transcriptional ArsR family regulator